MVVRSLLNETKKIKIKFPVSDLKWITPYEYFYQKTGVEFFLFSWAQSLLLNFDTQKRAEKIFKKFK